MLCTINAKSTEVNATDFTVIVTVTLVLALE